MAESEKTENDIKRALSLLGLAARGRNLVSGEDQVLAAIRDGTACAVVLAGDASPGTRKKFTDKTSYYHVPIRFLGDKVTLGKAIGREFRTSVAVTEAGLAAKLLELITNEELPEVRI